MPGYVELFIRLSHITILLPPATPDQTHANTRLTHRHRHACTRTHEFILKTHKQTGFQHLKSLGTDSTHAALSIKLQYT